MKSDKLYFFEQVITDLRSDGLELRGTCPNCENQSLRLAILGPDEFEPSCPHCSPQAIRDAIRAELIRRQGSKNGAHRPAAPLQQKPPPDKKERPAAEKPRTVAAPEGFTAEELIEMQIEPARYAIDGYICEGLNIFAGGQKKGKSWMAYGWAIAIAAGGCALGQIPVEQGEVIYLALEDGPRRLRQRLVSMLQGEPPPPGLHLYHKWPGANAGGITLLEEWLGEHPETRMVVIDTLGRFRGSRPQGGDVFQQDYDFGARLKRLADDHCLALVLLHHLSKRQCEDPFDQVSGTIAVTASADATLLLQRQRGKDEGTLFVTGRDVEEREMAVVWSKEAWAWTLAGTAEEFKQSAERREIIALLKRRGALKPQAVAEELGKNRSTIRNLLLRMTEKGELSSDGGLYWARTADEGQTE